MLKQCARGENNRLANSKYVAIFIKTKKKKQYREQKCKELIKHKLQLLANLANEICIIAN